MQKSFAHLFEGPNPSIIVFDCDYTLYPYDCDREYVAPFKLQMFGVTDCYGRWCDPFPHVSEILGAIVDAGIPVAFLSRNPSAVPLENLLRTIPLRSTTKGKTLWDAMPNRDYFHAYSAGGYGKGKDKHFAALRAVTDIHPKQMLFFDDMKDNIVAAAAQGTTSVLLGKSGLTWAAFTDGLRGWRESVTKIEAAATAAEKHPTEQHGPA